MWKAIQSKHSGRTWAQYQGNYESPVFRHIIFKMWAKTMHVQKAATMIIGNNDGQGNLGQVFQKWLYGTIFPNRTSCIAPHWVMWGQVQRKRYNHTFSKIFEHFGDFKFVRVGDTEVRKLQVHKQRFGGTKGLGVCVTVSLWHWHACLL